MKEKLKNKISRFITFFLILCSTFILFFAEDINALENDNSVLIKKVSKSFTNKFCNSIGFGLSKESAMNFSIKENNQVFNKRKGINDINKELLAEEIAISVIENCGYPINLSREKGVMEFKSYYLSKDKEYLGTK
tara:strand:+ start:485 stop:889 length:405 start_codon:yes stop_codon:yes gene_type:complete